MQKMSSSSSSSSDLPSPVRHAAANTHECIYSMAFDDTMDDEGTADTLNFFCRLPPERAKGIARKTTPPPMTWLHRILDQYEQPTNEVESQQARRKTDKSSRNRQQTDSSSVSSTSLLARTSSRSSTADASMFDEPEEAHRQEDDDEEVEEEEEEEEEEAPWFSQLANLPQVRSAGVPLVAPPSTIPIGKRTTKESSAVALSAGNAARRQYVNGRPPTSSYSRPAPTAADDGQASSVSTSVADTTSIGTSFNSSASSSAQHVDPCSAHESTSISSSRSSLLLPPPTTTIVTAQGNGSNGTTSTATASFAVAATKSAQPLDPPDNFAMVNSWVYRSSFPKKRHFPFLQSLKLKSVLTLILEEYPEQNMRFLDENGITFFQFGIPGNKEPFVQIPHEKITAALVTIMDRRNHPILIHCNKGKHRTGCLIGCLRKLQQWSLSTIFDEYRRFSFPKSRSMDQEFIELYREHVVWSKVQQGMLPRWAVLGKRVQAILDDEEEVKDDEGNGIEQIRPNDPRPSSIKPATIARQPNILRSRMTGM